MPEEAKGLTASVLGEVRPSLRQVLLDEYFPEVPNLTGWALLPGTEVKDSSGSLKTRLFCQFSSGCF
jgi:hypothetical protein